MTEPVMVSQPVSTTMTESSMFETSLETHLYGGTSIPPGYQSLYGTFSGVASSPWTSPMSSSFEIQSGTYLMSATQYAPPPPSQPSIKQQSGPYVSGYGHLQ